MNLRLLILTIFLTFISIKSIYADETHICGEVLKSNNPVNHILNLTEQEAQQFYNYIEPDQVTEFLKAKEDETTVILENIFKNKNTFSNTLQPLITLQAQFEKIALIAKYHKSRSEEQLEEWENLYDWATQLQKYLWVDAIFNPDFKTRFLSLYKQKDTLNQYERVQVESVHSKILSHQQEIQKNPILADTGLDYGTFAFDKIGIEHFYPAMVSSYQYVVSEFDKLIENVETPTFDSLIRAYIDMKSDFEKVETVLDTYFNNNNKKAWKVKLSQLAERYQNFSTDLDDR
ncbi:MAG: hypothetical protein KDD58_15940, partial [Bdellovibrionales bacterium]|nr:hypothetical protein [Bdellovibrionales bacterium]